MKLGNTHISGVQGIFFLLGALTIYFSLSPDASKQGFLWLNQVARVIPDTPLALISNWGHGETVASFWLILLCLRPSVLWKALAAIALAALVLNSMKSGFDALRPAAVLDDIRIVGAMRLNHSLPSAHTGTIFVLVGIAWRMCQRTDIKAALLLVALLVGLSRITNGAHWPLDVALGAWVGWGCARFAWCYVPDCRLTPRTCLLLLASLYTAVWMTTLQAKVPYPDLPLVGLQIKILLLLPLVGLYRLEQQLHTTPSVAKKSTSLAG